MLAHYMTQIVDFPLKRVAFLMLQLEYSFSEPLTHLCQTFLIAAKGFRKDDDAIQVEQQSLPLMTA